jgi:hypothetical protein
MSSFYVWDFKIAIKEINVDRNKWEDIHGPDTVKMTILLNVIFAIPIKMSMTQAYVAKSYTSLPT